MATDVKNTFFNGDPAHFRTSVQQLLDQFGVGSEDVRNLSIAALVGKLLANESSTGIQQKLIEVLNTAGRLGITNNKLSEVMAVEDLSAN